jgi:hypothetical protein
MSFEMSDKEVGQRRKGLSLSNGWVGVPHWM